MGKNFEADTFLYSGNAVFIEQLYQLYLSNSQHVDPYWQSFFEKFKGNEVDALKTVAKVIVEEQYGCVANSQTPIATTSVDNSAVNNLKARLLINAYRQRGHFLAKLDPLNIEPLKTKQELQLTLEDFGFTNEQLNQIFEVRSEISAINTCSLSELVNFLERTYCQNIAVEIDYLEEIEEKKWLFNELEKKSSTLNLSPQEKLVILKALLEVEGFEQYLHSKFPGAKRFSVEGGESLIVGLNKIIEIAAGLEVKNIIIGMAHRGRLSSLAQVMNKPYEEILADFIGKKIVETDNEFAGDVKYHMGYSSDKLTAKGEEIRLTLAYNPSHLEAVNPVIAGLARATQDIEKKLNPKQTMGILIHGDAAFCGQGVVAESLVMSSLKAYETKGIVHFVVNNQIGFTASSNEARASRYATEFAKIINAPILHVNGEQIEEVLLICELAISYRQKFGKDIVVDIVCYRKYGHNEGDEPAYTQAFMYNLIKNKLSPASIYEQRLIVEKAIEQSYSQKLREEFKLHLDSKYELAKNHLSPSIHSVQTARSHSNVQNLPLITGVNKTILKQLGSKLCQIPDDFKINLKLTKLFEQRINSLTTNETIDWATAEQLAFASLLVENTPIRLTGQDSQRGTFSHRHAVLHDDNDKLYTPLNNLSGEQAEFFIANSNLSEYAVLGFEYGYSLINRKQLVLWEAQFGDFVNGAQIIIDQFIVSGETKWRQLSGIVLLLPHGFEGQGPEHSSARLERFLQLAADNNIQVTYPTTPASIFHLLRRQTKLNSPKPLIIMSPKSLLRHKLAVSQLAEIDSGTYFVPILDEAERTIANKEEIVKVICCSGKIYYDLLEKRISLKLANTVIIRVEQLYPFSEHQAIEILSKYRNAKKFIWCQEEPKNMGAWGFINNYLMDCLQKAGINEQFQYVGRKAAASPATGYLSLHNHQQEEILEEALQR